MPLHRSLIILSLLLLAGCAHFQSRPLLPAESAENFQARTLASPELKTFLETNLHQRLDQWPLPAWDLKELTLAAIYFQPTLAEARAQLVLAQAGIITAGQRPNPTVSASPAYDGGIPDNFSPWLVPVTFDVPIETAGKRTKRLAEAEHLTEAARWNLAGTVSANPASCATSGLCKRAEFTSRCAFRGGVEPSAKACRLCA